MSKTSTRKPAGEPADKADTAPAHEAMPCRMSRFHGVALLAVLGIVGSGVTGMVVAPPAPVTMAPAATFVLDRPGDHGGRGRKGGLNTLQSRQSLSMLAASHGGQSALEPNPNTLTVAETRRILAYDLERIKNGASVPRIFLASIPAGLGDVPETEIKKALFYKGVLPLVLQANEEILAVRSRLRVIHGQRLAGQKPSAVDRLWLAMMSERYGVERDDTAALLKKADVVPPSLALAQAAMESGWGTSRFTREGNALFGQWTFSEGNLVPEDRKDGKEHMVKRFASLMDSVRAYLLNLNTHRAYREFRHDRAQLRAQNKPLNGDILAGTLHRYSELGMEYVNEIRTMISHNDLGWFDDSRLDEGGNDSSA